MIQRESDGFCDATEMCNQAGKLFADYLKLKGSNAYIAKLCDRLGKDRDELILLGHGYHDNGRHTWIHPGVALDLARWLGVDNAVDANLWILEQMENFKLSFLFQQRETAAAQHMANCHYKALMSGNEATTIADLRERILKRKTELRGWKPKEPHFRDRAMNSADDVLALLAGEANFKLPLPYLVKVVEAYEKAATGVEFVAIDMEHIDLWKTFTNHVLELKSLVDKEAIKARR